MKRSSLKQDPLHTTRYMEMKVKFKVMNRETVKFPFSNFNNSLQFCQPLSFVLWGKARTNFHVEGIPFFCRLAVFANKWECALKGHWRSDVATISWSLEGITLECVGLVLPKDDEQHYVDSLTIEVENHLCILFRFLWWEHHPKLWW